MHRLDIHGVGRGPEAVVKTARDRRERDGPFDEAWCVFDVDEHQDLEAAVKLAKEECINTAVSNPCFEVWLVWHFEDLTAHTEREPLKRRARSLGASNADLLRGFPYSRYTEALQRSMRSAHPVPANPGSKVSDAVRTIIGSSA